MRTRNRLIGVVAISVAMAAIAIGCSSGRNDSTSTGGGNTGTTTAGGGSAFAINTADCQEYNATQGISGDTIKFGSSFPQSGLYAPYADISKGYLAYFNYINGQGGVDGKKIQVVTKDDGYDSGQTKTNVQALTQQDNVFGIFNVVGTPNNMAIRDDLNDSCIPNLFAATGSQLMGNPAKYPWTIGSIPTYPTEAAVFAEYLKANKPQAKVAILAQNDDLGEGYTVAFKKAIADSQITVVDEEKYNATDPDVKSQITTLASSGADTLLVAAAAVKCAQALTAVGASGWTPLSYISGTCTSNTIMSLVQGDAGKGVISSIYLKDPSDPEWNSDAAMQQFQTLGAQNGLSADDLKNGIVGYGWTMGELLVNTIKQSGTVTRQSVMEAAYNLKQMQVGLLLPGITINTNGAQDPYPVEQLQIGKYNGSFWELQGNVISFEGQSGQFASNS